jgi:hypothetical protein
MIMKSRIAAALALGASALTSVANATTYTYTFDDMTYVPDQARDTFNTANYWENRGVDRWGMVWDIPFTFTTTYPNSAEYGHFHIGWKGLDDCYDTRTGAEGHKTNGTCVDLDPWTGRGPFYTHDFVQTLYFQLIKEDYTAAPFVVQNIDVYNTSTQSITVFVRKTDGGWFNWTNLHGWRNGAPSYNRVTLTSHYSGKFDAMAWRTSDGGGYSSAVGRVQITD